MHFLGDRIEVHAMTTGYAWLPPLLRARTRGVGRCAHHRRKARTRRDPATAGNGSMTTRGDTRTGFGDVVVHRHPVGITAGE